MSIPIASTSTTLQRPPTNRNRGVCRYFTTSRGCVAGDACKFMHIALNASTSEGPLLSPYDANKVCRYYQQVWYGYDSVVQEHPMNTCCSHGCGRDTVAGPEPAGSDMLCRTRPHLHLHLHPRLPSHPMIQRLPYLVVRLMTMKTKCSAQYATRSRTSLGFSVRHCNLCS